MCVLGHANPHYRAFYLLFIFKILFYFFFFIPFFFFWLCWVFVAVRRLFSSCDERGLLFVAVRGLLIVVASLVVLGTQASVVAARGLSSCSMWAQ